MTQSEQENPLSPMCQHEEACKPQRRVQEQHLQPFVLYSLIARPTSHDLRLFRSLLANLTSHDMFSFSAALGQACLKGLYVCPLVSATRIFYDLLGGEVARKGGERRLRKLEGNVMEWNGNNRRKRK